MELWGLTGIMGSGKSVAMDYLKKAGFDTLDTDMLSRNIWQNEYSGSSELRKSFVASFGSEFFKSNQELDRSRLRRFVASSPESREKLELLTHPHILSLLKQKLKKIELKNDPKAVFIEGTRLIESGFVSQLNGLICVTASKELSLERIKSRGTMSHDDAIKLMATQNVEKMKNASDYVWDNSRTEAFLFEQIDDFLRERNFK